MEKGGVRVGEKQSVKKMKEDDAYAVALGQNDWVKYGVDVPEDGVYSIAARVGRNSGGAKLKITVGTAELLCTIPETTAAEGETVRVSLGRTALKKGVQAMRVEVLSGNADFVAFETYQGAETPEEAELSGFKKVRGDVTFESGILAVTGTETHSVALWGNPGVADFEAEISFRCQLENNSNLGIMLRAEDYSYFSSQPTQSWRGYYLQLGQHIVALSRYDYGEDTMDAFRLDGELSDGGEIPVPELKKQIFIPFAKGYNGANGLGLSITKMILLQHQGDIALLSTRKGTLFRITIPMSVPNCISIGSDKS